MKALIFMLAMLCSVAGFAQKPPIKFGDVSVDDLKMVRYDNDSSAEAVILADYGESAIKYSQSLGFQVHFERLTRIKILSKGGLRWANFEIPLYDDGSNHEKLTNLKGITYNLVNGKIETLKLRNDAVFEEKTDKNRRVVKVPLPGVKEGSVVEITYNVISDFLFNFQDWYFQYEIPAMWSEYRVHIPEYFTYEKYMQGYVPLSISEQKSTPGSITLTSTQRSGSGWTPVTTSVSQNKIDFTENYFRWAAQDVPAFKPEPFITTYRDYISKINFELSYIRFPNEPIRNVMGDWTDISKKFLEYTDCGAEVKGNAFLKRTVEEITAGQDTPEKKIRAIHAYVKDNILWDGRYRMFTDGSLKKVLDERKGSSADINLLLASMLEKADIKVHPILLSTRDHGMIRENIPVASQFNYVACVAFWDDKPVLLDATEKLLPAGVLPQRCLNGNALIVANQEAQWIPLVSSYRSRTTREITVDLDPEGKLVGSLIIRRDGYHGHTMRKQYLSKGESDYIAQLNQDNTWLIKKSEFSATEKSDEPFVESHEMEISDAATVAGDIIYINPFFAAGKEENPFRLEKREYPVDFVTPFTELYMGRINIPEGYTVDELPESKIFALPGSVGKCMVNVSQQLGVVHITSNFTINKALFTQEEYPALREFYNLVVANHAGQIVLKKK